MTINLVDFRERVALCKDFTPAERDLLLSALALGDYSGKHQYPRNFGRDSSAPSVRAAWAILDNLPPTAMSTVHRFLLAGMISGALEKAAKRKLIE